MSLSLPLSGGSFRFPFPVSPSVPSVGDSSVTTPSLRSGSVPHIEDLSAARHGISTGISMIRYIENPTLLLKRVRDIGMDRFLVSDGRPLGTTGVASCFAVCSIGKTVRNTPVLGLCHMSSAAPINPVLKRLKEEMADQKGAIVDSIKTYVVGGEAPSLMVPEGTLDEERDIRAVSVQEKIESVLFNQTLAEDENDSLNVVLTFSAVYVSKKPLFLQTREAAGISLFDDEEIR